MMHNDLRDYLLADATLFALVNTRIFPAVIPQGTLFPCIGYMEVSTTRFLALDGPTGLAQWQMAFASFAETYQQAKAVGDAIRKRLDGKSKLTQGATYFGAITMASELDGFDAEAGVNAATPGLHRVVQDFRVTFNET
jgi:hypothetical protein